MDSVRFDVHLDGAVSEVLECMCFLPAEPASSPTSTDTSSWVRRCVEFTGPLRGRCGLRAPLPTARVIASNLLGQEEADLEDAQVGEALGEVTNMVCGALLGRLESMRPFSLSHPHPETEADTSAFDRVRSHSYDLEDGTLQVWVEAE